MYTEVAVCNMWTAFLWFWMGTSDGLF